jgi:membrane protease YdiL (CAAX protease family)
MRPPRILGLVGNRFAATGTLPRAPDVGRPDEMRRIRLIGELGILFILAPLFMRYVVYNHQVPLYYALPPVLGIMLALLFFDPTFKLGREFKTKFPRETLSSILIIFVIFGGVLAAWVATVMPERFFELPRTRSTRWLKLLVLYPFTSVLAQEFVYRVFFFHRYGTLFANQWTLIVVNGLAFAFAHILFRNWIAVTLTLAGGMLFAWRYHKTKSFWAVWFEHTLWGWLIFTVGLGVYFFTGVRNPAW